MSSHKREKRVITRRGKGKLRSEIFIGFVGSRGENTQFEWVFLDRQRRDEGFRLHRDFPFNAFDHLL